MSSHGVKIRFVNWSARAAWLTLFVSAIPACGMATFTEHGPEEPGGGDLSGTTEVTAALTNIPSGILCVQVKTSVGSQSVTKSFDVTAGSSSATLSLGKVPAGQAGFSGSAFTAACSAVTSTSTPEWIADAAAATLQPGVVTSVELTFRRNNPVTVSANFLENVAEISMGSFATYARMASGSVKQWGVFGGTVADQSLLPVDVPGLTDAVQVSAGNGFACARRKTGAVVCWGHNARGALGRPSASLPHSRTPVQVIASGAVDVSAGETYACAVVVPKTIVCWGSNEIGQLGNNTLTDSATPVQVTGFQNYVRVVASRDVTCALTDLGEVRCWGRNTSGQLGDGTRNNRPRPETVDGVTGTVDLAVGGAHVCTARGDGRVLCWGDGGSLGDGTEEFRFSPTLIDLTGVTQIEAANFHTCARRQDGTAACWGGIGYQGQLGDGTGQRRLVPTTVPGLTGVVAVRSRLNGHSCAELSNRTVKCWGLNQDGQLGDGSNITRFSPVTVKLQ